MFALASACASRPPRPSLRFVPRRPCFITHRIKLGFTSPSRVTPRLHRLLMHYTSERHGLRPSTRSALRPVQAATTASADFSPAQHRRPFRHKARSPQVRTHSFIAQPLHLRRFALITRASRSLARSPCSAAPSMQFLSIGSRFTLHASSPHSVALMQLRFTSFAVVSLWRDLHRRNAPMLGANEGRCIGSALFHLQHRHQLEVDRLADRHLLRIRRAALFRDCG